MYVSLGAIKKGIILMAFSPAYSINYNVTGGGVVVVAHSCGARCSARGSYLTDLLSRSDRSA